MGQAQSSRGLARNLIIVPTLPRRDANSTTSPAHQYFVSETAVLVCSWPRFKHLRTRQPSNAFGALPSNTLNRRAMGQSELNTLVNQRKQVAQGMKAAAPHRRPLVQRAVGASWAPPFSWRISRVPAFAKISIPTRAPANTG